MRVIVVGGGIAGLSTAWALRKRGASVTLVEQGVIPNPLAASGDHHRIIRRAYSAASGYAPMITEAFEAWESLWLDLRATHYDPRGFALFSQQDGDDADTLRAGLAEGGFEHRFVDDSEWARRFPFIERAAMQWGVVSPEGGALHCRKIALGLRDWLVENDAIVRENTRVTAIDPQSGSVTLEGGETLSGDRVVVAAGGWAPHLLPHMSGGLQVHRTAVTYVTPPASHAAAWAAAPIILDVGGTIDGYIIPPSGGAGLKFGSGRHKVPAFSADADRTPRPTESDEILAHFSGVIRDLDDYGRGLVMTCAYTFTADESFTAEEDGRVLMISACSGHGYKFGACVGLRAADAILSDGVEAYRRWLAPSRAFA
jgi:sarcosine oxidase